MKLPNLSLYVECSPEQGELSAALAKAQATFGPVVKDEKGPFGMFASLDSMIRATRPSLVQHGLAVIQPPQPILDDVGRLWCITDLKHASGQNYRAGCPSVLHDNPQKTLAHFSYMRRLSYGGLLCLASCDDNDGDGLTKGPTNQTVVMAMQKIQSAKTEQEMATVTARITATKNEGKITDEEAKTLMEQANAKTRKLQSRAKKGAETNDES